MVPRKRLGSRASSGRGCSSFQCFPLPCFSKGGERATRVPRKWRNGAAPSVDKIKSDDKTPSFPRSREPRVWGGCVTVVCRVTRVITVARLLARTPSQKTERTFRFSARSTILARTLITRQVPIGISLLTKPAFESNLRFTLSFSKNFHREVYYRPSNFVRSFERFSFPYDWWIIISSK